MRVQCHAEDVAKRIVELVLVGARLRRIEPDSQRTYDFELRDAVGHHYGAVEVTVSLNARAKSDNSQLQRQGAIVKAIHCRKSWCIQVLAGVDVRQVRDSVDAYLGAIEADGIDRFASIDGHVPSVGRILRELHILSGSVRRWEQPGNLRIELCGEAGVVDSEVAVRAALKEVCKKVAKTKFDGVKERHLAIYIDPTNYLPWKALVDCEPPSEPPRLPDPFTDIWVFAENRSNGYIVWRAGNLLPWCRTTVALAQS